MLNRKQEQNRWKNGDFHRNWNLKNQADILEVKNIVPEAKDSLDGFKSQLCKRGQK